MEETVLSGEVKLSVSADGTATISGLGWGSYVLTETAAPENYETPVGDAAKHPFTISQDTFKEMAGTIALGSIRNTRMLGSLKMQKTVVGTDREFTYTVIFKGYTGKVLLDGKEAELTRVTVSDPGTGEEVATNDGKLTVTGMKNGAEKVVSGIPYGTQYSVTEEMADGYVQTGASGTAGEIGKETPDPTASFTNTKTEGLTITKTVENPVGSVDAAKEFVFTVTLNNGSYVGTFKLDGEDKTLAEDDHGQFEIRLKHGESASLTRPCMWERHGR